MGCLNSEGQFGHWFANIHLSGPCNRACYFCIGQHMMDLDPYNNLDTWPLDNLDQFVNQCNQRGIKEVNLTGSNTDPLLYKHNHKLVQYLRDNIPGVRLGMRTNAVQALIKPDEVELFDKASFSITSLDPIIYKQTMGMGRPPDVQAIINRFSDMDWKANVVMCPESVYSGDIYNTIYKFASMGVSRINLREPYGQTHIGNPLKFMTPAGEKLGMPYYKVGDTEIMYWDVHFVEVESVNLYANGRVSTTYPVTKGHSENGQVFDQGKFGQGRHTEQWQGIKFYNKKDVANA